MLPPDVDLTISTVPRLLVPVIESGRGCDFPAVGHRADACRLNDLN